MDTSLSGTVPARELSCVATAGQPSASRQLRAPESDPKREGGAHGDTPSLPQAESGRERGREPGGRQRLAAGTSQASGNLVKTSKDKETSCNSE